MKRLLTLIGVVATLLLTPTNAKAWGDLYLLNNIWGSWRSTDTNSDYKFTKVNDNEFTYSLDASDYEGDIFWKINTPGDWSGQREIHPDNDGYEVRESGYNAKYDSSYSGKSFKISHSTNNYTHYTITARWDSGGEGFWYVKVVGRGSKGTTQAVYLLGTINSWTGNSYKLEKDGDEYKLELTKAQVQNALHQGDFYFRFKEEMDNSKTYTVVPQTDQTPLTVDGDYTSVTYATTKTDDSKKDFYWKFTPTGADKYFIYFKNENNTRKVRVATPPHDYYWVSPQITNGEMWPAFKMVASRNRYWDGHQVIGDGKISTKYYTFTIKDDDLVTWKTKSEIGTDTEIQWYILRDDGQVVYRPATDLDAGYKPHDNNPYDTNHPISGNTDNEGYVSFINYWNGISYDGDKAYMTTAAPHNEGSWKFLKGSALAHTFNLNAEKGHVLYNYTNKGASTTRGYNLVGNWTADTKASIHLSEGKSMTKYWFKGGVGSTTEVAGADSIVYKIDITKEALGIDSWGGLYLDISPSDNGTEDNDTNWGKVFRPLITTGNNLDGRALHGALTTRKDEQSLNPETSEDYLGYTFSFNATTMTYRLEFHTSLYLVGPGVSDSDKEDEKGKWDLSNVTSSDPRIRLTPTQEAGHYRNRVYFTKGQPFRFIKNTDESTNLNYKYTWYENSYKPKWESADNDDEYYPGSETQFRNNVQYENDASASNTAPKEDDDHQSMTFDLPSGWYYVNFYPNAGTPYYTIEHSMELRDFNEVYYRSAAVPAGEVRNVKGRNGYNFLRVWSDHIAWNKPDDIDVFVVSAFGHNAETHETTATLTKLNVNYIPANTGVILGCKLSKDNLTSGLVYKNAATLAYNNNENVNYYNTLTAELTPYSVPSTSYTAGESKLIPLYEETELKRFSNEGGTDYANYLFGFYRCKKYKIYDGSYNDFDLGFWLTTGEGKTYANSAFLQLTKAQAEDLGVGTAYDNIGSASAPAFMLLFDESDDNVITGISDITTAKGNSVASQGWYTLQGVRTAKPTQRGIYIYNGKKVVVND